MYDIPKYSLLILKYNNKNDLNSITSRNIFKTIFCNISRIIIVRFLIKRWYSFIRFRIFISKRIVVANRIALKQIKILISTLYAVLALSFLSLSLLILLESLEEFEALESLEALEELELLESLEALEEFEALFELESNPQFNSSSIQILFSN